MKIQETYINKDEGYSFGKSGWFEPYTNERGKLFRSLQREYGRCVSKVYVDQLQVNGRMVPVECGWVFEKRLPYEDCKDLYTREVWVSIQEEEKGV